MSPPPLGLSWKVPRWSVECSLLVKSDVGRIAFLWVTVASSQEDGGRDEGARAVGLGIAASGNVHERSDVGVSVCVRSPLVMPSAATLANRSATPTVATTKMSRLTAPPSSRGSPEREGGDSSAPPSKLINAATLASMRYYAHPPNGVSFDFAPVQTGQDRPLCWTGALRTSENPWLPGTSVNKAYSTTLGRAVARSWRTDPRPT